MIEVEQERPGLHRIRFDETDDNPERRTIQRWRWHSLREVTKCLNNQRRDWEFTEENVLRNFAALCGHQGAIPVITYVAKLRTMIGHSFTMGSPVDKFVFRTDLDYFIPAGWGMKITDHEHMKDVVGVELQVTTENEEGFILWGMNNIGKPVRQLPCKLSPEMVDVLREP